MHNQNVFCYCVFIGEWFAVDTAFLTLLLINDFDVTLDVIMVMRMAGIIFIDDYLALL